MSMVTSAEMTWLPKNYYNSVPIDVVFLYDWHTYTLYSLSNVVDKNEKSQKLKRKQPVCINSKFTFRNDCISFPNDMKTGYGDFIFVQIVMRS